MRSWHIDRVFGIDALKFAETEVPEPGPGQLLVQMRAASLNYRDLMMVSGSYTKNLPFPLVPLSDGSGEVVKAGPGVSSWKAGDKVIGTFFQAWPSGGITDAVSRSALGGAINGVLAEYVLFREEGLVRLPDGFSFEEGATLPCAALTAWNALSAGGLTVGDTVLTMGSGGVSVFALQFARAAGARVIATTGTASKMERLKALGAAEVIDYKSTPDWEKRVLQITANRGVDQVMEVGGAGTLLKSMKAVRTGGCIALIGVLTGNAGEVNPLPVVMKAIRIQGIFVGSREMFEAMNRAVALHRIRPVIDKVFPLDAAKEAYRHLESGSHFGKVVISF